MLNDSTHTDYSPAEEDSNLTYDKLRAMLDLPKFEFCAFTVTGYGKQLLLEQTKNCDETSDSPLMPFSMSLVGISIYVVSRQVTDFIKWTDKAAAFCLAPATNGANSLGKNIKPSG